MARQSLFHILSRQPWWLSALVAAALFATAQLLFPPVAAFVALPFLLLAAYLGYRQLRGTAAVDVEDRLAALREMSWDEFSAAVTDAYRRQGYTVEKSSDSAYDYTLRKNGRVTLLACRRWKTSSVGAAPLRALAEAVNREDAYNGICLAAGSFSDNARGYAATQPITLVSGADLAKLVRGAGRASRAAPRAH